MSSTNFICARCASLRERMASEQRQELDCTNLERKHLELQASSLDSWDIQEHEALARRYQAEARVHYCRYRKARDTLAAVEIAYSEKLEAAHRGAA